MRIVTKITAGLLLLAAVGCREMPTVTGGGRTLAKAGGATLDEQELGRALPGGADGRRQRRLRRVVCPQMDRQAVEAVGGRTALFGFGRRHRGEGRGLPPVVADPQARPVLCGRTHRHDLHRGGHCGLLQRSQGGVQARSAAGQGAYRALSGEPPPVVQTARTGQGEFGRPLAGSGRHLRQERFRVEGVRGSGRRGAILRPTCRCVREWHRSS